MTDELNEMVQYNLFVKTHDIENTKDRNENLSPQKSPGTLPALGIANAFNIK